MPSTFAQIREWFYFSFGEREEAMMTTKTISVLVVVVVPTTATAAQWPKTKKDIWALHLTVYKHGAEPDYAGLIWFCTTMIRIHKYVYIWEWECPFLLFRSFIRSITLGNGIFNLVFKKMEVILKKVREKWESERARNANKRLWKK